MNAGIAMGYRGLQHIILQWWRKLDSILTARQSIWFWALAIVYKFVLDALYVWAASPQGLAEGLLYEPDFIRYMVACVLYFGIYMALPKRECDTVAFLLHLQFVYTVAPLLCYYSFAKGSHKYMLMVTFCILLQCWVVCQKSDRKGAPIYIKGIQNYVTVAFGVVTIFCLVIPVLYNGFAGLKAFDFSYIYVMRGNEEYPPLFPRILAWVTDVGVPFFILYALQKKKYLMAVLPAIAVLISYMETGYKADLLMLAPILAIFLLAKSGHLIKIMYAGMTVICLLTLLAYRLDRNAGVVNFGILINSLVSIRALFFPARLKFAYYSCFNIFPKLYFSEGLLGHVFSLFYPYKDNVGHVVTASMGHDFASSGSNTGYLGDAYAQMGFLGMILMSLLLAFVLRGLRTYDSKKTGPVIAGLFATYMITLNDGALLTVLLTSGMALAFLMVFIYFGKELKEENHGVQRL